MGSRTREFDDFMWLAGYRVRYHVPDQVPRTGLCCTPTAYRATAYPSHAPPTQMMVDVVYVSMSAYPSPASVEFTHYCQPLPSMIQ